MWQPRTTARGGAPGRDVPARAGVVCGLPVLKVVGGWVPVALDIKTCA